LRAFQGKLPESLDVSMLTQVRRRLLPLVLVAWTFVQESMPRCGRQGKAQRLPAALVA
jgi:hypothetical protein